MSIHHHAGAGSPTQRHAGDAARGGRVEDRRRLLCALAISGLLLLVELVGGIWAGSLSLLADAGHLLADVAALGVALFACTIATRPATPHKTFGYYRIEILSALFNGVLLIVIAGGVAIAAVGRLGAPPLVHTDRLIWIAAIGLAGNLLAIALLLPRARGSLNLRGALAHVAGDTLSSVIVLAGGAVMARTGWYALDPLLSLGIAVVILFGAWRLLREAVDILLEAVPGGLDPEQIANAITEVPGVGAVHDLHIWSITSGMTALSGHVILDGPAHARSDDVLNHIKEMLRNRFAIEHTTIQVESESYAEVGEIHS